MDDTLTRKDFNPIWDDYTFFETHTTELAANLSAYLQHFQTWREERRRLGSGRPFRVLDFGCGSGSFIKRFLARAGIDRAEILIALVEPNPYTRQLAATEIRLLTDFPVRAWPALPERGNFLFGYFDLILSHHVLYYVPDLQETLERLLAWLSPRGLLLTSLGGPDNQLVRAWQELFPLLGQEPPYYTAGEVLDCLGRCDCRTQTSLVQSRLDFPDSAENRQRILRFLFDDHLTRLPTEPARCFFDRYVSDDRVVLDNTDQLFIITHPEARHGPTTD